jgi:translation initiation factor IF-2
MKDNFEIRPPVVVFLGHIDAGKSSLLSSIQQVNLTDKESGGITQHLGAYEASYQEKKIVFLDTPGHAAFSSIRSRGAKLADLAVLVVGRDQGVLPQTKEAIAYLQETGLPTIIALNKSDQPGLPLEKIKDQLAKAGLQLEDQGGKIPLVETSAKNSQGINDLLDLILLLAEMEEFKTDTQKPASGFVLESYLDHQRGPLIGLLVKNGTLQVGDIIGTNSTVGRLKEILSWEGKSLEQAFPSQPVKVLGLKGLPAAGEEFQVYSSLEKAQEKIQKKEEKKTISTEEEKKEKLKIILKADVFSSLEALQKIIGELKDFNRLQILSSAVGDVSQNDVQLAETNKAQIIGFRVKANAVASSLLKRKNVSFQSFSVIYELLNYLEGELKKVAREKIRTVVGRLEVLAIFWTKKNRQIVGGKVIEGELTPSLSLTVFRGSEEIGQGKIVGLEREQKKMEKVKKDQTAGILYEGTGKIEKGDILEAYLYNYQ